ncbi:hypothetical protein GCM10012289_16760 [Nonomuraea cavernae]|uniref:Uncharacterized protein n=1 Tax=Nonomuraea cavernae TaxID=2045107 RepID=A0A917YVD7_9ACTN|nr:hypothetical protein GCM10012289_16760 [Nonomuraea cavernae]
MASRTRSAVAGLTPGSPFTTRETVLSATPAAEATSFIVGLTLGSLHLLEAGDPVLEGGKESQNNVIKSNTCPIVG